MHGARRVQYGVNLSRANFTKWSNTLKQFVGADELFESV